MDPRVADQKGGNPTGRRNDGLGRAGLRGDLAGQCIWFGVSGARLVGQSEAEPPQEVGPSGLPSVEAPGRLEVFVVAMVRPQIRKAKTTVWQREEYRQGIYSEQGQGIKLTNKLE